MTNLPIIPHGKSVVNPSSLTFCISTRCNMSPVQKKKTFHPIAGEDPNHANNANVGRVDIYIYTLRSYIHVKSISIFIQFRK